MIEAASADHIPAVQALIEGLSKKQPQPGYFIHIGGTGMLNDVSNGFGRVDVIETDGLRWLELVLIACRSTFR
jgi:hypothetical protein